MSSTAAACGTETIRPFPARSCVEAKLARPELLVEIEAVALA